MHARAIGSFCTDACAWVADHSECRADLLGVISLKTRNLAMPRCGGFGLGWRPAKPPGSRRGSHPPAPPKPGRTLSRHPARAAPLSGSFGGFPLREQTLWLLADAFPPSS